MEGTFIPKFYFFNELNEVLKTKTILSDIMIEACDLTILKDKLCSENNAVKGTTNYRSLKVRTNLGAKRKLKLERMRMWKTWKSYFPFLLTQPVS